MALNSKNRSLLQWTLVVLTVAGLSIDAFVHFDLASAYDGVKSSTLSQGDLFRGEATVAAIAGAALLLRPRRWTAALACVVAGAGTAAVLVYASINVGAFGPFPNMYEPTWYGEKTLSVVAEGVATLTALALFGILHLAAGGRRGRLAAPAGVRAAVR